MLPPLEHPPRTLVEAQQGFLHTLQKQHKSHHTITAFAHDLNLLLAYAGNIPLEQLTPALLQRFVEWLRYERGPCQPKTLQRRITALKAFGSWLQQNGLGPNPAVSLIYPPVAVPPPRILSEAEQEQLLRTAQLERDPLPYLLIKLVLATGVKRSEAIAIRLEDIDLSTSPPSLYIRPDPRHPERERRLWLPDDFSFAYTRYVQHYYPQHYLLEGHSIRHLTDVMHRASRRAGIEPPASFEDLRWTCAVRDWRAGMIPDMIRRKLGLSPITWEQGGTRQRLERLASRGL